MVEYLEYIIPIVIIVITIVFFMTKKNEKPTKSKSKSKTPIPKENKTPNLTKPVPEPEQDEESKDRIVNNKDILLNSFREVKELKNPFISKDGKTLLFSDEKRVLVGFISSFIDKNIKFLSKTIESDVVSDLAYSDEKKLLVVALKNSKEIVFYHLENDENNKQKLVKLEKKIKTLRKYEIKNIVITKDGNFIATSGTGQDTIVQIYNASNCTLVEAIDISEIQNVEMKFTHDDKYLTISTFMYEIAVVEFKKTLKFNKALEGDEVILKVIYKIIL